MLTGCDLSHHNATPDTFAPYAFSCIRVSFGRGTDGAPEGDMRAEQHAAKMRKTRPDCVGVAFHWLNLFDGREQAAMLTTREAIVGAGAWGLAIDVEDLPEQPPFDRAEYARTLLRAIEYINVTSWDVRHVLTYGNKSTLDAMTAAAPDVMAEVARVSPLWMADWEAPYTLPIGWDRIAILQDRGAPAGGRDHDIFAGTAEELRAVLGLAPGPLPPSHVHGILARGGIGPEVRGLQSLLNARGASLRVDGVFGPLTEGAVRAFQRASGLDVDGIAGPATWSALDASP